jgi:hypothetical protein
VRCYHHPDQAGTTFKFLLSALPEIRHREIWSVLSLRGLLRPISFNSTGCQGISSQFTKLRIGT